MDYFHPLWDNTATIYPLGLTKTGARRDCLRRRADWRVVSVPSVNIKIKDDWLFSMLKIHINYKEDLKYLIVFNNLIIITKKYND